MKKYLILMSVIFCFMAPASFIPETNAQETNIALKDIIKSQNMIYMTGFKEKDAAKVASVHTEMTRVFPPNRFPVLGRAAVIDMINEEVAFGDVELTLETLSVERQGDAVLEIGKFSVKVTVADGTVINDHGNTVVIWKKDESGQWLMDLDIWNSTVPLL